VSERRTGPGGEPHDGVRKEFQANDRTVTLLLHGGEEGHQIGESSGEREEDSQGEGRGPRAQSMARSGHLRIWGGGMPRLLRIVPAACRWLGPSFSSREKREGVRRGKRPQSVMRQGGEFVGSAPNSKAMQWGSHVPGIASVRAELQQKIRWERNPETLSFSGQHRIRGGKRMPRPLRIVLRSRSMLT
jgi:hypothetical protein